MFLHPQGWFILIHLIVFSIIVSNVHPRDEKYVSRYEFYDVRESAANHPSASSENFRRIRFAVIYSSGASSVDVCIEWRDNRVVERERDIEKPLHRPGEG